ncbi:MAG: type 1 glutamine amidotransferase [Candidatus Omnitrophica bacterium]|nr:type 1 glutamine amidotransferase [Candidatus Omnitrophota bacterium]
MILFIKHIDIEGPETIGRFFQDKGYDISIVNLQDGDELPSNLNDIQAVVCLGGPMNVYEEDLYPFLKKENIFIQKVLQNEIPYLGICLGAQLLAKASGSRVTKSPQREVGFFPVKLTEQGVSDPLFSNLNSSLDVYQWHEDMAELSDERRLLAASTGCPTQAFKVGSNAYGLQFHIEITDKSIKEWSDSYFNDPKVCEREKNKMLSDYNKIKTNFENTAHTVYNNFIHIMNSTKANV